MVCRESKVASALLTLYRKAYGLSDSQIQSVFHELRRDVGKELVEKGLVGKREATRRLRSVTALINQAHEEEGEYLEYLVAA